MHRLIDKKEAKIFERFLLYAQKLSIILYKKEKKNKNKNLCALHTNDALLGEKEKSILAYSTTVFEVYLCVDLPFFSFSL